MGLTIFVGIILELAADVDVAAGQSTCGITTS